MFSWTFVWSSNVKIFLFCRNRTRHISILKLIFLSSLQFKLGRECDFSSSISAAIPHFALARRKTKRVMVSACWLCCQNDNNDDDDEIFHRWNSKEKHKHFRGSSLSLVSTISAEFIFFSRYCFVIFFVCCFSFNFASVLFIYSGIASSMENNRTFSTFHFHPFIHLFFFCAFFDLFWNSIVTSIFSSIWIRRKKFFFSFRKGQILMNRSTFFHLLCSMGLIRWARPIHVKSFEQVFSHGWVKLLCIFNDKSGRSQNIDSNFSSWYVLFFVLSSIIKM